MFEKTSFNFLDYVQTGWFRYTPTMFRRCGSTSFLNETVPKHCVNTKNSKRQKRRRYKAEQSETVLLHYLRRSGTAPFLALKRSKTDVNSDLSVTKTVLKWFETVTSEHGRNEMKPFFWLELT